MRTFLLLAIGCFLSLFSAAQDSVVVYHNSKGVVTKHKDSATTYTVFTRQGTEWYGKTYYVKNNVLESQGTYSTLDGSNPVGLFDYYNDSSVLQTTYVYDNDSKLKSKTQYYPSGQKQSYIEWKKNGKVEQKGWDEQGNAIRGFIVEQEAMFDGGINAWRKYLEKNLDSRVPEKNNVKPGIYTVVVTFRIDKEGKISEVKAARVPPGCAPCADEAVRVILEGPDWKPAIQNNKPVIYRQQQSITFVLEEEKKKGQ